MKSMHDGARPRPVASRSRAGAAGLVAMVCAVGRGSLFVARRKPGLVAGFATVAVVGGLFSWNALEKQSGRHPAPLFASAPPVTAVEPPRRPEAAAIPVPVPRPDPMQTAAIPRPDAAARAGADGIGALIRSGDGTGAARSSDAAKSDAAKSDLAKADAAKVAAAQKALAKLGYGPLKPDGVMGTGTRQAIEKFEREKNLPVSGALNPRTAKKLATLSGLPLN